METPNQGHPRGQFPRVQSAEDMRRGLEVAAALKTLPPPVGALLAGMLARLAYLEEGAKNFARAIGALGESSSVLLRAMPRVACVEGHETITHAESATRDLDVVCSFPGCGRPAFHVLPKNPPPPTGPTGPQETPPCPT